MAHHECAKACAHPKEQEPFFGFLRVVVLDQDRPVVVEDRLGFLEGNAVLALVRTVLGCVPLNS